MSIEENVIKDEVLSRSQLEKLIKSRVEQNAEPFIFEECDFAEGDFSRLDLSDSSFKRCTFMDASFYAAVLERTSWQRCRAGSANFENARLSEAKFTACDLNNTKWRSARLAETAFDGCKLTGANFEACTGIALTFKDSLLISAFLRNLSFRKTTIQRVDFAEADLAHCDFRDVIFEECSLRDAHMKFARFDGADLRQVDLGGLKLNDAAMFRGAVISASQATQLLAELGIHVM
ncbi:pentapeptide repeat-containing protein [Glaciimonas soli]|uniref:pentapeptide repeat-containing protein n=1 Tax=Glaciimonas soli TaxID=2590999 RepID=UPI001292D91A|nr:pentapeptide repeat-containing protein [Glaciimonas soli]